MNDIGVLRLWHIDSFEGGKGSRAAFLNRAASAFEKQNNGLYIMVSTYTPLGAARAIEGGNTPDLLSFSCGIDGTDAVCRALSSLRFGGGEMEERCYAYPWCAGEYYLFCLEEDFSAVNGQNLLISDGGNNLPWVAAALYGLKGEIPSKDSTSAYVQFLQGKYRYMLGTQRDVCRFQTRGVNVYRQKIETYSDLFQYIAISTQEEGLFSVCESFIKYLLSKEQQQKLSEIGMYAAQDIQVRHTLSAFVDQSALNQIRLYGQNALQSGNIKNLKNYLKSLN